MDAPPVAVSLAALLLGDEHALVCQALCSYQMGGTEGELVRETKLLPDRVKFILWDLHNFGLGNYKTPIFFLHTEQCLEQAIEGIACTEERRRFNGALQRSAACVAAKRGAPHPLKKQRKKRKLNVGGGKQ